MTDYEHLITVPTRIPHSKIATQCDARDAWEDLRQLSRLSAPAKAKMARSLEKAQADARQARDGKGYLDSCTL